MMTSYVVVVVSRPHFCPVVMMISHNDLRMLAFFCRSVRYGFLPAQIWWDTACSTQCVVCVLSQMGCS